LQIGVGTSAQAIHAEFELYYLFAPLRFYHQPCHARPFFVLE